MKTVIVLLLCSFVIYGQGTEKKKLSLKEALDIALQNNPELKAASENISASKGRFWSRISLPQPEVDVRYEYTPVNSSLSNFSERTIEVRQSFEFPSNYFLKGSKLTREEEIAVQQYNQTQRSVIARIKSAFYKALAKKELLKNAEENLSISEDFYKKAGIRYNVGEGTNIERLTAKVQSIEAKNNYEVAKNELRIAYAELNYVLGYGRETREIEYELQDRLTFSENEFTIDSLYNDAELFNAQIKIAELNQNISSINKTLAWSSLLPNFNLSYFKQTRDGDIGFYGASFGVSVPLWFLFDQRGKIEEASANQNIAEAELHSTKNIITLKIKNSFTDYQNNLKQVKLYLNDILPQAEEIYRAATKSYDAGELTYLEYLQAKQTLITSKSNYINALLNYNLSLFTLEETVGQSLLK